MAIPSRPIGQDPASQQLWRISKQLEQIIGLIGNSITTTTSTTTTSTTSTSTSTTTSTTTTALP